MTLSRPSAKILRLCLGLGLAAAGVAALASAQESLAEFRGRIFMGAGPNRASALTTRIIINGYTGLDEVRKLQDRLAAGDRDGFYDVFRSMKKGEMRFIGGQGLKVNFNVAYEEQTEKGIKILLASESRSIETGVSKRVAGSDLFFIVELDLDAKHEGEGKIYEDGRIAFTPEGGIKRDTYLTPPKMIVNVRKSK
jgi:hypothetical protein